MQFQFTIGLNEFVEFFWCFLGQLPNFADLSFQNHFCLLYPDCELFLFIKSLQLIFNFYKMFDVVHLYLALNLLLWFTYFVASVHFLSLWLSGITGIILVIVKVHLAGKYLSGFSPELKLFLLLSIPLSSLLVFYRCRDEVDDIVGYFVHF